MKLLDPLAVLTPRQREIVRLAAAGAGDKGIAKALGISVFTVTNHFRSIYQRFGVNQRRELLAAISGTPLVGTVASALHGKFLP